MDRRTDGGPVERPEPADVPFQHDRRRNGDFMLAEPGPNDERPRKQRRIIAARAAAETTAAWAEAGESCLSEGMFMMIADLRRSTLPSGVVDRLASVKAGTSRLDYKALAQLLWGVYQEDLPYSFDELRGRIRDYVRDLRRRCREEIEERAARMSTFLEKIPALYERLYRLSMPGAGGGTAGSLALPDNLAPEVYAEILNVVRGAVGRVLPREYGEGIRDADVDQVEDLLLQLGKKLQDQWGDNPEAKGLIAEDLKKFLAGLLDYDPATPSCDFVLLNSGARLLIELTGPTSFFGLFAQLNIYQVIDRLLSRDQYLDVMQRMADDADTLAQDRSVRDMVAGLNRSVPSGQEGLPSARRLVSYCLGNLVFAALDTALAEDTPEGNRKPLLARAKTAAGVIAQKDSAFEQNAWYKLAIAAAEAEVLGDEQRFATAVHGLGIKEAFIISERIRRQVDRDVLIGAIDRRLLRLLRSAGQKASP